MAFESRSTYEYGDDEERRRPELLAEERTDHARALARGDRLHALSREVVDTLLGAGLVRDRLSAMPVVFHVLADALYPDAAIDIPDFTREPR